MAVFKFRNLKNGQATPIPPGQFSIGRADDAYIHLEDPSVSRHHAQISNTTEGFFVEDLGSSNGTAYKGGRVTGRVQIQYDDILYFGVVPFRIDAEVAGEPSASPSGGLRQVNRAYIHRDTARISLKELSASQKLVSLGPLPSLAAKPAGVEETPVDQPPSPPLTPVEKSAPPAPEPSMSLLSPAPVPTESTARPASAWWMLIIFLAGVGTGLLLGLYFAKVFLDLGGKAALLP